MTGPDSGLISPQWTSSEADRWDQLILKLRSHEGPHVVEVYWSNKKSAGSFSPKSVVRFKARRDGKFHRYVVPMANHPNWSGTIRHLRVDPVGERAPSNGTGWWFDLGAVFLQNGRSKKVAGRPSYTKSAPVKLLGGDSDSGGGTITTSGGSGSSSGAGSGPSLGAPLIPADRRGPGRRGRAALGDRRYTSRL